MQRFISLLLICMLLLVASALAPARPAASQAGAWLPVHPAALMLARGERALVEIWVEDVVDLRGFEVELAFNPVRLLVDPESLSPGGFLGAGFASPATDVDNTTGMLVFGTAIIGDDVRSGSGVLFTFEIQAQDIPGLAFLNIASADLVDEAYFPIPHAVEHGTVWISGAGALYKSSCR